MNNEFHLKQLVPSFRQKVEKALIAWNVWASTEKCKNLFGGAEVIIGITDSRRDIYEQAGKYTQGRIWNKDTKKWSVQNEGLVVTRTLHSKHLDGLAVDIAPFISGKAIWPDPQSHVGAIFWLQVRSIGESCNMKSGSRFLKPDWPHFEEFDSTVESNNIVPLKNA